jgi:hypothetical protein
MATGDQASTSGGPYLVSTDAYGIVFLLVMGGFREMMPGSAARGGRKQKA